MTDRELLERIRLVMSEAAQLVQVAGANSQYHTRSFLVQATIDLKEAEGSLACHVEN